MIVDLIFVFSNSSANAAGGMDYYADEEGHEYYILFLYLRLMFYIIICARNVTQLVDLKLTMSFKHIFAIGHMTFACYCNDKQCYSGTGFGCPLNRKMHQLKGS